MKKSEYDPSDLRKSTISSLFYKQIKELTMKSNIKKADPFEVDTFNIQFSDQWI